MNRTMSYRGLLADGGQDIINLHTNDGKTGYKIVKLQLMPENFNVTDEYNIKVHKVETTGTTKFDFSDITLLAGGYFENSNAATEAPGSGTVVFDNEIFNQDIYVTQNSQSGNPCNYYIELEQMDLTEDEALVAIVKNLRNEQ
jgi:hypothetical protein